MPRSMIVLCGLLVAPAVFAQDADNASLRDENARLRAEVEALRQTMQRMETRLEAVENNHAPSPPPGTADTGTAPPAAPSNVANVTGSIAPQAATVAVATPAMGERISTATAVGVPPTRLPAQNSVSDPGAGASRVNNAPPPTDPDLKGFFDVPGTETKIRIGGYAKLDAIADNHDAGNDTQFIPATFPARADDRDHSHFNMQAQQTRFTFEARRPTEYGSLRFYLENDFFGGDANGYQFHLRHAYGQIGNTYAGYGYSSFMDADSLPDTLDFAGPGGQMFLLQPGIHQAFPFGEGNSLTIAGERPQTEISTASDVAHAKGATQAPDLIVALRRERDWGHVQAGLLLRRLGYTAGKTESHATGWGLALTGAWSLVGQDLFMASAVYGRGIARYLSDTSGSGLDALVEPDGQLHALKAWGWYGAYTHYWTTQWRSNLVYGQARVPSRKGLASTAFDLSDYAAVNMIWSPAPTWTMGVELLHGKLEQQGGNRANDTRLQGSVQYSFIK